MFITIINDSRDDNAKVRQIVRWSNLFPKATVSFAGVGSGLGDSATLEAAGNLVDFLDAGAGQGGIVTLNVAPRGQRKDGENGSSFCYFWYKKTLVISTIKGYNLSLVKKLELARLTNLLDTRQVLNFAWENKLITKKQNYYITNSQFRSFDFQPRVAKWIWDGKKIPSEKLSIEKVADIPSTIWLIDSFGNAKTTLTIEDIDINSKSRPGGAIRAEGPPQIKTNLGPFKYYERLKDIPSGETAFYTGSSGIENRRFLEIATQNREGSAAKTLDLKVGKEIKFL